MTSVGPMKECNAVACHNLVPYDVAYCAKHKDQANDGVRNSNKLYDRNRNKKFRKIYESTRWRKLRLQMLLRDGYLCQECRRQGLYTVANVVDHIIELRDDMSKAYDINNLESLCHACHNAKTKTEKEKRNEGPRQI